MVSFRGYIFDKQTEISGSGISSHVEQWISIGHFRETKNTQ